ncbi:MAG: UDP-N-acetylglucosamine 1-carboxyvinyltransferase [Candidatus Omnitrophica bacterium]|nr:UDP-N-acetylglucosamine 1-carboxyvinyltransferase [Candidatus Omnitrophota bacterium]
MDKVVINGGRRLEGQITVSGAKNAVLPILAATLLTEDKSVIKNVPRVVDVQTIIKIIEALGVQVNNEGDRVEVIPGRYTSFTAPYELVSTMRASVCVLGALLAKVGRARVSMPGGCVIGLRPVDLHLKGLRALGAKIKFNHGYIDAVSSCLRGADIYLGGAFGSSVLATANVMMAATLAKGRTVIEGAACEPEIVDLGNFLNKMGAGISGHNSPVIVIDGVKKLHGAEHTVIADRIEAGTYMIAGAITKGDITLKNVCFSHLGAVIDKLKEAGVDILKGNGFLRVRREKELKPIDVTTLPYPGFPTDLQAQMTALMAVAGGISIITEKIYPGRFMHVSELNRMGAEIYIEGPSAIVKGVKSLSGAPVMASDLRASAALILAGLTAKGKTEVSRIYHLDRGYEKIEDKLSVLGADILRQKE